MCLRVREAIRFDMPGLLIQVIMPLEFWASMQQTVATGGSHARQQTESVPG